MYKRAILVLLLLVTIVSTVSAATVGQALNYQGVLTDSSGNPLNGQYTIYFRLYDAPSGGNLLQIRFRSVQVSNGLFTTPVPFDSNLFDGRALWVGIAVDADPEMIPRQEIRPVPYALSLRPGATIAGSGTTPVLNLTKLDNGGKGLNVITSGTGSHGIWGETTGPASNGVVAISYQSPALWAETFANKTASISTRTTKNEGRGVETYNYGPNSRGFYASTSGTGSEGVYAITHGYGSEGVYAATEGEESDGVRAATTGNASHGVGVTTIGRGSIGYYARTSGTDSPGLYALTSGVGSQGVFAHTTGTGSKGVDAQTSGSNSVGVNVSTTGASSIGVLAATMGNHSKAIVGTTKGTDSDGMYAWTNGSGSNGITAITNGFMSNGVQVSTWGYQSYGLASGTAGEYSTGIQTETNGQYSAGVFARTSGPHSNGIDAISTQASAIWAETGRSDNKYGVQTPDIIRALGYETGSSDVAEYIPVNGEVSPGTVLVIGADGKLHTSTTAYDTGVAGIVSTAPGVSLGAKEEGNPGEMPIAVAGRVPCKVDASYGPIHPRDLLTTSNTPGYAMKAQPVNIGGVEIYRPGTVLGKAMGTLESGTGTIEVLVTLQ